MVSFIKWVLWEFRILWYEQIYDICGLSFSIFSLEKGNYVSSIQYPMIIPVIELQLAWQNLVWFLEGESCLFFLKFNYCIFFFCGSARKKKRDKVKRELF